MNTMEYKGYIGSADVDMEGGAIVGKLLFIRDTITYSSTDLAGLRAAFEEAVDDYLATCQELGDAPDQPCKGSFNVRVGAARHRDAALAARAAGMTLNEYICHALDQAHLAKHDHSTHNHFGPVTVQLTTTEQPMLASTSSASPRSISRATAH